MMKLLTAIRMSPRFNMRGVTTVCCYGCRKPMPLKEAYVDGKGYIWCARCK